MKLGWDFGFKDAHPLIVFEPADLPPAIVRPGARWLVKPRQVQFWNYGPLDWNLIERELAGWLADA